MHKKAQLKGEYVKHRSFKHVPSARRFQGRPTPFSVKYLFGEAEIA